MNAAWSQVSIPTGLGSMAYNTSTINDVAPSSPAVSDRWIKPATGEEMVWMPAASGGGAWLNPAQAAVPPLPLPVVVASGGTGATTPAGALTNLGIPLHDRLSVTDTAPGTTATLNSASGNCYLYISGPVVTERRLVFSTGALARWYIAANATPESGANAGSDFVISRRNDAGVQIDSPMIISRATGTMSYLGHINPSATGAYDLGSASLRWRNVYTSDLHLSNGIGDYTIVEGEEDLFLRNNKSGKTYKFALIEVS
jgi:hypothetical protein